MKVVDLSRGVQGIDLEEYYTNLHMMPICEQKSYELKGQTLQLVLDLFNLGSNRQNAAKLAPSLFDNHLIIWSNQVIIHDTKPEKENDSIDNFEDDIDEIPGKIIQTQPLNKNPNFLFCDFQNDLENTSLFSEITTLVDGIFQLVQTHECE